LRPTGRETEKQAINLSFFYKPGDGEFTASQHLSTAVSFFAFSVFFLALEFLFSLLLEHFGMEWRERRNKKGKTTAHGLV